MAQESISQLIRTAHDSFGKLMEETFREDGLTEAQGFTMGWLVEREMNGHKTCVNDVAQFLGVSQPTASGILRRMEKKGRIFRTQDPTDGRIQLIHVAQTDGYIPVEDLEAILRGDMTEAEAEELARLLRVANRNLEGRMKELEKS